MEEQNKSKYEQYCEYFNKIKELCIEAYKWDVVSDEDYFIKHGIPKDFMAQCKKAHLCGGGKGKKNLYFNWHTNKKFPNDTIDNFLDFIKEKEIKGGK